MLVQDPLDWLQSSKQFVINVSYTWSQSKDSFALYEDGACKCHFSQVADTIITASFKELNLGEVGQFLELIMKNECLFSLNEYIYLKCDDCMFYDEIQTRHKRLRAILVGKGLDKLVEVTQNTISHMPQ